MGHFRRLLGWREAGKSARRGGRRAPFRRALGIEPLEDRRLLTTVTTLVDEADGSIVDGDVSLRDAIALSVAGSTIDFDPALTAGGPATMNLTPSAITIAKALTITGPGANLLTIVANDPTPTFNNRDGNRVFNITDGVAGFLSVTIQGLKLTGADFNGFGGAINSTESLTLQNMVINENSAVNGAGVGATGPLSIFDSEINDNVATGAGAGIHINTAAVSATIQVVRTTVRNNTISNSGRGGGIFAVIPVSSPLRVTDSLIADNTAILDGGGISCNTGPLIVTNSAIIHNHSNANGGGIKAAGALTVDGSQIENNSAAAGGGIHSDAGTIALLGSSTIYNNSATGDGGGIVLQNALSKLTQLTVSGNKANGSGGGVYTTQKIDILHSTIVNNNADFDAAGGGTGGGVHYTQAAGTAILLDHTILAMNIHGASTGDDAIGPLAAEFSWIGIEDTVGLSIIDNGGNHKGNSAAPLDPQLAALASNDGPTLHGGYALLTHSPLLGSPVVDAGDPNRIAGTPPTPILDERGSGYMRIYNATSLPQSTIDIGAVELQPSALAGDYNFDRAVNAADYTVWRNTKGSATDKRADGDHDGDVDMEDYSTWKSHYGETLATAGAASGSALMETAAAPAADEMSNASIASAAMVENSTEENGSAGSEQHAANRFTGPLGESDRTSSAPRLVVSEAAAAASQDDALLAWLALSTAGAHSDSDQGGVDVAGSVPENDASPGDLDSLDAVFAGLSGDAL